MVHLIIRISYAMQMNGSIFIINIQINIIIKLMIMMMVNNSSIITQLHTRNINYTLLRQPVTLFNYTQILQETWIIIHLIIFILLLLSYRCNNIKFTMNNYEIHIILFHV